MILFMDENFIYAEKLNTLGDKITEIGNKYYNSTDDKDVKSIIKSYSIGAEKYKECANILAEIKAPKKVESEHKQMINELNMFADATISISDAIDTVNVESNKSIIESKLRLHHQVTHNIVALTTRIGDILLADIS